MAMKGPGAVSSSDRLLSISDVSRLTGLTEDAVRRLVHRGDIPAPLRIGPRIERWRQRDVASLVRGPRVIRSAGTP